MKWIKYEIHTTTKDAATIGDILTECGIAGFEISDHIPLSKKEEEKMYTDIPADLGIDDGSSVLTFYTEVPGEEKEFYSTGSSLRDEELVDSTPVLPPDEMVRMIQERIQNFSPYFKLDIPDISYEIQDDSLWKDKWKENFKAFHVAEDIIIKPIWEARPEDAKDTDIIIEIEPGSAFGTGTHETTKLCLLSLRKYITPTTTLLDAGCGSGILALSAVLSGAAFAFCLDIDPMAVKGTLENAAYNHLNTNRLQAIHANILEDGKAVKSVCPEPFDIAVANILADVIIPLADKIGDFIKPGGLFISSGILSERAADVEEALKKNQFEILEKNTMGEWTCFVCRK